LGRHNNLINILYEEVYYMDSVKLEVMDPTGIDPRLDGSIGAPRINTLEGKRIGLVWNNKDYGDKLLEQVKDLLQKRYPTAQFIMFRLKECCVPPPPGELEKIAKEVEAVIYTLGD
jgi:hypothetical protein